MAHKQVYLSNKREKWVKQFRPDVVKGSALNAPVPIAARYQKAMQGLIKQMVKEAEKEVLGLFRMPEYGYVQDDTISSQARILLNKLQDKFTLLFNRAASDETKKMVERSLKDSAVDLKKSLKDMAGEITIKTDIFTDDLKDVVTASIAEGVGLFKRIPQKYFAQIEGEVFRSITTGQGLKDLIPAFAKYNVQIRNYAKNTALDQTRKAYNTIAAKRAQAVGLDEYEWVHSGGSHQPRELHKKPFSQGGLNGGIFKYSEPPIIDERTGERGIPGQAINCRCTMRPILRFNDDE